MGHFCTLVFSRETAQVDGLLRPYDIHVRPGDSHAAFQPNDYAPVDAVTGRKGFWVNPNAKLDWYCIGGRWQDVLHEGGAGRRSSQLRADICSFEPDPVRYERAVNHWNFIMDGTPMPGGERAPTLHYGIPYYLNRYGTRENYAKAMAGVLADAFVDENGLWHEASPILHTGPSPAAPQERQRYSEELQAMLKRAREQRLYITACDCHI